MRLGRWLRFVGLALLLLLVVAGAGVAWLLGDVPSLEPWRRHEMPVADGPVRPGEVHVTFLGVATLLIDDGETQILTDAFFTRPGLASVLFGRIAPEPERIADWMARAGAGRAAAVVVVHSHYDHAMDAPEAARITGGVVVGSESTANVARGWGLPEAQIVVPKLDEPLSFGRFRVSLIASEHFPHGMAMGEITEPLVPPARALDYLDGGSFTVWIEHPAGTLAVQGSAGWREGALLGRRADVLLLGVGGLGGRDDAYRDAYWKELVESTRPRLVVPIHWDDFTRSLAEPLRPMPRLQDDFGVVMTHLEARAAGTPGLELALLPPLRPVKLLPVDR